MDLINKLTSEKKEASAEQTSAQKTESSGRVMDKLNGIAGGGKQSEEQEDMLDKSIDWVQEKILKQGPQDNESAVEQAKDEQISDAIRAQYKTATGKDFPIADKDRKFGS